MRLTRNTDIIGPGMAAAHELHAAEIVELSRVTADELEPVLQEERITWRSTLRWDFSSSAELVRRFVRIRALGGYALLISGRVVGYTYYVVEDRKGLIGDLYILREFSCQEYEDTLLAAVLEALVAAPGVCRIEAQLMMMRGPFERTLPLSSYARIHSRVFMLADAADSGHLPQGKGSHSLRYHLWSENRAEESALLIAAAYKGHIDATINDQYSSVAGARRFINNIVQYPGCGSFFPPSSLVADRRTAVWRESFSEVWWPRTRGTSHKFVFCRRTKLRVSDMSLYAAHSMCSRKTVANV